jgi:ribosomal protein L7/L12
MKSAKHLFLTVLALAALLAGAWAQTADSTAPAPKPRKKHKPVAEEPAPPAVTAADVQALKDALAAQQLQIQQLSQQLQQTQQNWQQAQAAAADAANKAAAAQSQASEQQQTVGALQGDVAALKTTTNNTAMSLQESLKEVKNVSSEWETPVSLHLKGITITPGGFAEAAFVRRSRELGADLTTPFNSLTMPGASQSNLSEFFGSARQSRATVFVGGRLSNVELSSYLSGDFLSAGVTSSATQTNSYTFRLRQAWGQARFDNGWKILGGQMWSLLTENKQGIGPSDDLGRVNDSRPMTIDPGYNAGFTFARQYGLRITKDFGTKASIAFAMENAQGTLMTHGNADNFLLGEAGASNSYNTTGTYTANPAPDLIAKIAFDPGFGHYEIFGMVDRFTDRVFPCVENFASAACGTLTAASAINAYNASKEGGGFGANARWAFANKHIVFGLHGFGGSGVGRYGAAQLPDLSINPDGTVHLIKDLQGLVTLEYHGKKLDVYAYTGADYAARTYGFDQLLNKGAGEYVGYGSPTFNNYGCYTELPPTVNTGFTPTTLANCTGDTRALIEGTIGFWYRFYNGPRGRVQFGTQYSYVSRQTWSGVGSAAGVTPATQTSPEGLDGMVFTSFRYYLP